MIGKIFQRWTGKVAAIAVFLLLVWPAYASRAAESGNLVGRTTLSLKLACGACLRVIDSELRKKPGILGMTANFAAGLLTVDHELRLTPVDVAADVTACGYHARVVDVRIIPRSQARLFQPDLGFGGSGYCNLGGANPVGDSWRELCRRFMRKRMMGMGRN